MNTKKIRRENVMALIDQRFDGNKAAFARAIDRPAPNVHRMLVMPSDDQKDRRGIGEDLARGIERRLGLEPGWLDVPRAPEGTKEIVTYDFFNITHGPDFRGRIPLISWVQAGVFCQTIDQFEPGDAERWLLTTQNLGPHAYALRVKGDSMVNPIPGGHTYPEGSIVYVDPDVAVTNGCRVIAKIPDADEATFKVYAEDAGKRWLKPLNPQYPIIEMTEGMVICGVVRAVLREE